MTPGAYVFCRKIDSKYLNPQHQFMVLVPEKRSTLPNAVTAKGKRVLVLGAYNVFGKLRAAFNAPSDLAAVRQYLYDGKASGVQLDRVRLQACIVGGEDFFLDELHKRFRFYKMWEGNKDEIPYPAGGSTFETVSAQMDSSRFNSNSWVQSLVLWTSVSVVAGLVTQDFKGQDVGSDRVIPQKYFMPPFKT